MLLTALGKLPCCSNEFFDKLFNILESRETPIGVAGELFLKKNAENVLELETIVYLCNQNYKQTLKTIDLNQMAGNLKVIQKIRSSFTKQLTIWVAGGVVVITAVVIFLLGRFAQQVILEESVEITLQSLENMAVRISNELRQSDISAQLENRPFSISKAMIEQLIEKDNQLKAIRQSQPSIKIQVTEVKAGTAPEAVWQNAQKNYVFQELIYGNKFCITATCYPEDLYAKYVEVQWLLAWSFLIGVGVLLLILWLVMGHYLRPLHTLADSAQRIADGHINERIPDSHHKDEIGQLQNSLATMQLSLADYMDEMQQKQTELNMQNAQLQEAYDEAQEYDRMKDKFLHDTTNEMTGPVELICRNTNTICADYQTMSKAEIARMQIDILQATECVTSLLDQSFTEDE